MPERYLHFHVVEMGYENCICVVILELALYLQNSDFSFLILFFLRTWILKLNFSSFSRKHVRGFEIFAYFFLCIEMKYC